ncbi:MAG: hypothetical protein IPJ19_13475 [Planctomycetes bacterium]|nr:hypothetical protein [Planctomycetota bacterium]
MTVESHELNVRVERLEKQNKSLKRLGAGLALGLGLLGLASAKMVCDTVTGERLVIHDSSGRTRVSVDAYTSDTPGLVFHNRDGRASARMGVNEQTGELVMNVYDARGKVKATWSLGNEAPKTQEAAPTKKADGPLTMAR